MPILFGAEATPVIVRWACERLESPNLAGGVGAIGITNAEDTDLIGAVLYTGYQPVAGTVEVWGVGEGNWLTPTKLKAMFSYPFEELGCNRITMRVDRINKHARDVVRRLGFKEEGNLREALGPGRDLIVYGMLKRECRWIARNDGHQT